jgi:hypothetical protein
MLGSLDAGKLGGWEGKKERRWEGEKVGRWRIGQIRNWEYLEVGSGNAEGGNIKSCLTALLDWF